MEIRQIYYVLEVAEQKNFSKAADKLYISQSNISQQIRSLEKELGVDLFVRDRHSVELTRDGMRFCIRAREVVRALNRLMSDFGLGTTDKKETINVAMFPFSQKVGIASIVRQFFYSEANTLGSLYVVDNYDAYDGLREGRYDIAIIKLFGDSKLPEYTYHKLQEEDFVAMISRGNPLTANETLDAAALSQLNVFSAAIGTHVYDDIKRLYDLMGAELHPLSVSTMDIYALADMIRHDDGVTFGSVSAAQSLADEYDDITFRDLDPPVKYNTYIVYPKDRKLTGTFRKFVDYIVENYSK